MVDDLLRLPTDELLARAAAARDAATGSRITFSPKVFLPLTELCRDRCGYCTFAKAPARLHSPYMPPDEVLRIARQGAAAGCSEALFTLGEAPEERYPTARAWLDDHGWSSTVDYLVAMCRLVLEETGLLPHANPGALPEGDLARLREVAPSQGMMLESLRADLACHRGAPDKEPHRRLGTLEAAGRLKIAYTTGILVGIGEDEADRIEALVAIADSHRRHGHVQEVIVQGFLPKAGTAMQASPPVRVDVHLRAVALARLVLPPEVVVQAPPNLSDDPGRLLDAGIADWGGVSPVTVDHVNPERPWPGLDRLRRLTEARGLALAPRLTAHPRYVLDPATWLAPGVRTKVLQRADAEGLARDSAWISGGEVLPPVLVPGAAGVRSGSPVGEVLAGVLLGQEPGEDELTTLFGARGREVVSVCEAADDLRRRDVGDVVTWVSNRNINYTNVCTFKCRFCAFSKGPLSLNLRGSPYLLGLDEISRRVTEAVERGATEVCLQGGIHPSFDGDYYLEVTRAVRQASKSIHIHGFTALEVTEGARRNGEPLADYLRRLMDAGLRTLPGTAAEILDDDVRRVLCADKVTTDEWLDAHRTAHRVGLRSNVTIMFGSIEQPRSWARHLVVTRDLQKETGGFTEFVPLPFVHMAAPIYRQGHARRGPTFRETLLMHAVGRIAYTGHIPNIQVSWVKMGLDGARQVLLAGGNDLGGTLMDENISRAAGASHGQAMDEDGFRSVLEGLPGPRRLEQRTTLYGRVAQPA
ncbi:MAG: 7,8-didemethyl-8-hydroxy-5-deazariboflavin synthase subunit 1 / 7,8-didemethyl-8-hydroxy-5-deazariboflavin synthase subunit 2 [uncultured Acidimicrobiales bacterium]|uniref:FO synthase n=1 Tax=uncultured Acidimicrobiales bacterium TaxID=310071 RepID=A0A6J4I6N8_9ACTN|nr:MAG: 7,8-didemethyl-8-hydroxy-5-deazariboflavin synthase subunit 1 / 7,8-didemethyl-8-hydroxy-5-deazariboflavin synthase subunit 2 [uncultured Acidimicrobiales bacterium]